MSWAFNITNQVFTYSGKNSTQLLLEKLFLKQEQFSAFSANPISNPFFKKQATQQVICIFFEVDLFLCLSWTVFPV